MATRSATTKEGSKSEKDTLTCPECGRTFSRPAALGAHRKLKHGVAGSSANAKANRTTNSRRRARTAATRARVTTPTATNGTVRSIDRDALLGAIFPDGIPPRQDVIARVNAWLEEAERLAGSR